MPPTPEDTIFTCTSSVFIATSEAVNASSVPRTSVLRIILKMLRFGLPMPANILSISAACCIACTESLRRVRRNSATSFAFFSSASTTNSSPASGTPVRPRISTGIEGPADLMFTPFSSTKARTRPYSLPTSTISPVRSVPFCTSTDATAPRPLSRRDSTTTPCPGTSV